MHVYKNLAAPRSGLAAKHSIDVGAGVIDADYRGNVGVILFNFGTKEFKGKHVGIKLYTCMYKAAFLSFSSPISCKITIQ